MQMPPGVHLTQFRKSSCRICRDFIIKFNDELKINMENSTLNYNEQEPFAAAEFADNPEPRCPCLLLLDTSGSMHGRAIDELNASLQAFRDELLADSLSAKRVEVGIVTFGPVSIAHDFTTVENFTAPHLTASGDTPMGAAISTALELLKTRKEILRNNGIQLFRPWIFLITDGAPTDSWQHTPPLIRQGEENKSFSFFTLGVTGADFNTLQQISARAPIKLEGVKFREFFLWLSASLKSVSQSNPGESVALPDYRPYGWAEV